MESSSASEDPVRHRGHRVGNTLRPRTVRPTVHRPVLQGEALHLYLGSWLAEDSGYYGLGLGLGDTTHLYLLGLQLQINPHRARKSSVKNSNRSWSGLCKYRRNSLRLFRVTYKICYLIAPPSKTTNREDQLIEKTTSFF